MKQGADPVSFINLQRKYHKMLILYRDKVVDRENTECYHKIRSDTKILH